MCCAGERHFAHVEDALPAGSRSAAQTGPSGTFAARVRVCVSYARVVICGYVKAITSKAVATLASSPAKQRAWRSHSPPVAAMRVYALVGIAVL